MSYIKRFLEEKVDELCCKYNWDYGTVMDLFGYYQDLDVVEGIMKEVQELAIEEAG